MRVQVEATTQHSPLLEHTYQPLGVCCSNHCIVVYNLEEKSLIAMILLILENQFLKLSNTYF